MTSCPFCGKNFESFKDEDVKKIAMLLSKKYNSKLCIFYPHIFKFCANCGMVDCNVSSAKDLERIKDVLLDCNEILHQKLDSVDPLKFARIAECRGFICETLGDIAGATLSYKSALDIIECEINDFEEKNIKLISNGKNLDSVLVDVDMEEFEDAKIYAKSLRDLVASTSGKSFDKLGYLGILIYLDTIIEYSDFVKPAQMFALLNDPTTHFPKELLEAKEQLENRFIKFRKKKNSIKK